MKKKIYVVKKGRIPGIYDTWKEAEIQVRGFRGAQYRGFTYMTEREQEDETVEGSLAQARKQAEEYLGDVPGEEYPRDTEKKELQKELKSSEEVFSLTGLYTDSYGNSPWIGLLIEYVLNPHSVINHSVVKHPLPYCCTSIYTALLYLVLDEDRVFHDRWGVPGRLDDEWFDEDDALEPSVWDIWHKSEDYIRLKKRFEKYGTRKEDLPELAYRAKVKAKIVSDENTSLCPPGESYLAMRNFFRQGSHTVTGLYRELTRNPVYRRELLEVNGAFWNPDLDEEEAQMEESAASVQYIKTQTDALVQELYEKVVGQDEVIDQFRSAWFHKELKAGMDNKKRRPRHVYLFAGPPGVGKTFIAEIVADTLNIPYMPFDMSAYSGHENAQGLVGFEKSWRGAEPGALTSFVSENPRCVLLFDEIEKAHAQVILLFLQILDEGRCIDKFYNKNVDFRNTIIIMTTNAGKQLYQDAENENLALLPDAVIMDALKKDTKPDTKTPFFPPEIISRMFSHTVLMFNHLRADAILKIIKRDLDRQLALFQEKYGYDLYCGKGILAKTALYSMGGSMDARNASVLAGKLINRALLSLLTLVDEKMGLDEQESSRYITWKQDFSGATDEILQFYFGEKDCVIAVFGEAGELPPVNAEHFKENNAQVRITVDPEEFNRILQEENVLLAILDYEYGMEEKSGNLSITDCQTEGSKVFTCIREEYKDSIPVYILYGDRGYAYSRSEKGELCRRGVKGFIKRERFRWELRTVYEDTCCQRAMETLSLRHQRVAYDLKQELNGPQRSGSIVFCNFRLETAVEAEDKDLLLSADMTPDAHWGDIYVPKPIKNELKFFIDYLTNPQSFRQAGVRAPRGVLLVGGPGTGKTLLARVVAAESDVSFLEVHADLLKGRGPGEVRRVFRTARKYAPAVLFIDEVDTIGASRQDEADNSVLNALLTEMNGFLKTDDRPIFLMAATNMGQTIDSALLRRFDRVFTLLPPDREGIRWKLEQLLQKHSDRFQVPPEEMDGLVTHFEGITFAVLENIMETALREAVRSGIPADHIRLYETFDEMMMGNTRGDVPLETMRRTAYHEAGHALVSLAHGMNPNYMSVVARGSYGGYMANAPAEDNTKESMLKAICICLGGRTAEDVCGYGLSSGASNDLEKATQLAASMVCSLGMYEEEFGLAVIPVKEFHNNEKARVLVGRIIAEQSGKAAEIINSNREALERLVDAVMASQTKSLTKKEIAAAYKDL